MGFTHLDKGVVIAGYTPRVLSEEEIINLNHRIRELLGMGSTSNKDVKQLLRKLVAKGWRIEQAKRNAHYKAYPPKGKGFITISESPSCAYWLKNCLGDIKRLEKANNITDKVGN